MDWENIISDVLICDGNCNNQILEGYTIPTKSIYCNDCYSKLKDDVKKKCVEFKNESVIIDSNYLEEVFADGMCLHSNPCQHRVYIELKRYLTEEEIEKAEEEAVNKFSSSYHDRNYYQISNRMNGIQICRLMILCGNKYKDHFEEYEKEVEKLIAGKIIHIRLGLDIKINESFVDPRT